MAARSPLDADCCPGNELVQFVLSDVPLGLSKMAANYTLYAAHSGDVVSSGVQLALDGANFGSSADAILSTLMSWSDMSSKGRLGDPACQKIGRLGGRSP
jgi:hypothetical protein